MKKLFAVVITCNIALTSLAAAPPEKATEIPLKEVSAQVVQYIKAHSTGDFSIFEKAVSRYFIEKGGGEKEYRKFLMSQKTTYKGTSPRDIEVLPYPGNPEKFVTRYNLVRGKKIITRKNASWLVVQKDEQGHWRIHDALTDYDPTDKGP